MIVILVSCAVQLPPMKQASANVKKVISFLDSEGDFQTILLKIVDFLS